MKKALAAVAALYVARMVVVAIDDYRACNLLADQLATMAQTMREHVYIQEWITQDKPSPEAIAWMRSGR